MRSFKMEVLTAVAAWTLGSASMKLAPGYNTNWHRTDASLVALEARLSSSAKIYTNGTAEFEEASSRWSVLDAPKVSIVVVPGTENDVVETVCLFLFTSSMFIRIALASVGQ